MILFRDCLGDIRDLSLAARDRCGLPVTSLNSPYAARFLSLYFYLAPQVYRAALDSEYAVYN
jgi:hypothetical protein